MRKQQVRWTQRRQKDRRDIARPGERRIMDRRQGPQKLSPRRNPLAPGKHLLALLIAVMVITIGVIAQSMVIEAPTIVRIFMALIPLALLIYAIFIIYKTRRKL